LAVSDLVEVFIDGRAGLGEAGLRADSLTVCLAFVALGILAPLVGKDA
jgi:hypothetical protein